MNHSDRSAQPPSHRTPLLWAVLATAAIAAAALLLLAPGASAAYSVGTPLVTGKMTTGVTVNQSSQELWAASMGGSGEFGPVEAGDVKRFDSSGGELPCTLTPAPGHPGGVAVSPVTGKVFLLDVQTKTNTRMRVFPPACGSEEVEFALPIGNARPVPNYVFDSAGNIYVASVQEGRIEKCTEAGSCTNLITGLNRPASVARDSAGNIYVADNTTSGSASSEGRLQEFDSSGALIGTFAGLGIGSSVTTVAVDQSNDHVFVGRGWGETFHIEEYDSGGSLIQDFGLGAFEHNPIGIYAYNQMAVNETTGTLYVADGGYDGNPANTGKVQVFEFEAPKFTLTTSTSGTAGSVECKIDGGAQGACPEGAEEVSEGSSVELFAVPGAESDFAGWTSGPCESTPSENRLY